MDNFNRLIKEDNFIRLIKEDNFNRLIKEDNFNRLIKEDNFNRLIKEDIYISDEYMDDDNALHSEEEINIRGEQDLSRQVKFNKIDMDVCYLHSFVDGLKTDDKLSDASTSSKKFPDSLKYSSSSSENLPFESPSHQNSLKTGVSTNLANPMLPPELALFSRRLKSFSQLLTDWSPQKDPEQSEEIRKASPAPADRETNCLQSVTNNQLRLPECLKGISIKPLGSCNVDREARKKFWQESEVQYVLEAASKKKITCKLASQILGASYKLTCIKCKEYNQNVQDCNEATELSPQISLEKSDKDSHREKAERLSSSLPTSTTEPSPTSVPTSINVPTAISLQVSPDSQQTARSIPKYKKCRNRNIISTRSEMQEITNHVDRPKQLKHLKCSRCAFSCSLASHFLLHVHSVHRRHLKLECKFCDVQCNSIEKLTQHNLSVHDGLQEFNCPRCHRVFNQPKNLIMHILNVHENYALYCCRFCNYADSLKYKLNEHIKLVHQN